MQKPCQWNEWRGASLAHCWVLFSPLLSPLQALFAVRLAEATWGVAGAWAEPRCVPQLRSAVAPPPPSPWPAALCPGAPAPSPRVTAPGQRGEGRSFAEGACGASWSPRPQLCGGGTLAATRRWVGLLLGKAGCFSVRFSPCRHQVAGGDAAGEGCGATETRLSGEGAHH